MKFLVVTAAPTFKKRIGLFAYAPYVKEMNIWFNKVQTPIVISPITYPEKIHLESFKEADLELKEIPFISFNRKKEILFSILKLPVVIFKLLQGYFWADHIHLRGPSNISLIGCLLQIFFPGKPKTAKYAGNWDPESRQPWSYKLQKWILRNRFLTRNMQVLVYGKWPNQSKNVLPFFTASFSEKDRVVLKKRFSTPFRFLFAGSLVDGKNPLMAIQIVEQLRETGLEVQLEIFGDGPLRRFLEDYAIRRGLTLIINFKGNRDLEELKEAYKTAHFVILPSISEGWPKVIAEGMFFSCIPIATQVSCVPWMLGYGTRGILLEELSRNSKLKVKHQELLNLNVEKIKKHIENLEELNRMSKEAGNWSQQYTLEKFEKAIHEVLAVAHPYNKNRNGK